MPNRILLVSTESEIKAGYLIPGAERAPVISGASVRQGCAQFPGAAAKEHGSDNPLPLFSLRQAVGYRQEVCMIQDSFIPLIGRNQRVAVRNTGYLLAR